MMTQRKLVLSLVIIISLMSIALIKNLNTGKYAILYQDALPRGQNNSSTARTGLGKAMEFIKNNPDSGLLLPDNSIKEFKQLTVHKEVVCSEWKFYGATKDGFWPVCRMRYFLPKQPCTVYSFGINYDWAFDDVYRATHNCTIRTFDPSMGKTKEHEHSPGVFFYPLGLSDRKEVTHKGWHMDTYKGFLTRFNDNKKIIPYLKFDVEHYEWQVLINMLSDGVLSNVMQLSFEIHIFSWVHVRKYIELLKALHPLGFRRWYFRDHFNGKKASFLYQCDQSYINLNFVKSS